eukprot:1154837-Pelagomonas_calceolata.AAC.5
MPVCHLCLREISLCVSASSATTVLERVTVLSASATCASVPACGTYASAMCAELHYPPHL